MKARKILFYIFASIALAINVFIIVESCVGGEGSASQSFSFSESFADLIDSFNPDGVVVTDRIAFHSAIRKVVGHFLFFGLSGLFTTLAILFNDFMRIKYKWKNLIFSGVFGLVIALISELIQYFVPGRYGVMTDVLIDYSGYVLFMGLTYLFIYLLLIKRVDQKVAIQ